LFVSGSILHFIFNMLFLYWFGTIIGDLIGDKKILPLYILGGLSGAVSYLILGFIIFPGSNFMILGLDSVILSFAVASAVLAPDYGLRLILIGNIRLKFLVIIFVLLEFLYALSSYNPIYLSYLGSVIFGWYYIYSMRRGNDISNKFNKIINIFSGLKSKQKRNLSVTFKSGNKKRDYKVKDNEYKKELDRILDKIKQEGYDNLSDEEKEFLFLASKRE
ncbi:MAG TPA: rhomboid family intramembrane serine protease, partial [Bacteroidetes bacterium]|nr:rhomboid family intramembrane serine protease [Bacteroidota bacterium]